MVSFGGSFWLPILFCFCVVSSVSITEETLENELVSYRKRVEAMFYHAYNNYLELAFPYDELRPLTCDGVNTWGNFQLTLIDALDTLVILGNTSEFRRVAELVVDQLQDFDIDVNTSVFEANIRVVGGLLSAHLFSKKAGHILEHGWPCSGPLLRLAEDLGRRLLPAFDTATGMPYGTVNLKHGVPQGETSITCTACVGTFIIEFGTLSRLTGDSSFEKAALTALDSLQSSKSTIGLVGNHIDVQKNSWHALDAGIGAGVDSYFEYLVKGSLMFEMPELMRQFKEYALSIATYLQHGDWHFWAHMHKGSITQPVFQSLEAFWPGMLSLIGETESASSIMASYFNIWKKFGFTPEFFEVTKGRPMSKREGYPLRPELIESAMYLYQATSDPLFLNIGKSILTSIEESAKVPCGFATIKDVNDHSLDNRMESFFLAETTKYLYLLFTPNHWIFQGGNPEAVETLTSPINSQNASECLLGAAGYIFNTEAHPMDVSAVHCCSKEKVAEDLEVKKILQRISLMSLSEEEGEDGALDHFFSGQDEQDEEERFLKAMVETDRDDNDIAATVVVNKMNLSTKPTAEDRKQNGNIHKASSNTKQMLQNSAIVDDTQTTIDGDTSSKLDSDVKSNMKDRDLKNSDLQNQAAFYERNNLPLPASTGDHHPGEIDKTKKTIQATDPVKVAEAEIKDTWRQVAANILTQLKAKTGLKVADQLKSLLVEEKHYNPFLCSNVGSWDLMSCPKRSWPMDVGVMPHY